MLSACSLRQEVNSSTCLCAETKSKISEYLKWEEVAENLMELQAAVKMLPVTKSFLEKRFLNRLQFGTAGLRDVMGVGYAAMNHVTIQQTTQAVCLYYSKSLGEEEFKKRGVVLGYDGRHNSKFFADICAAVFISKGVKVYLFPILTPTPFTPYGVVKYNAGCGIQITASHNPKADNGYKLYGPNGAQIIPPVDSEIAELILQQTERFEKTMDLMHYTHSGGYLNRSSPMMSMIVDPYKDICTSYMKQMKSDLVCSERQTKYVKNTDLKIVYTAMHGVGYVAIKDVLLDQLEFPASNFFTVPEQRDADPEFSTVSFPNPEEKGALKLAMALADSVGSSLVIANDPDADRFAAAEKFEGKWHQFHGDELGILFGSIMHERANMRGVPKERQLYVNSAVSSAMLGTMARAEGCQHSETMTGFKWMMNQALDQQSKSGMVPCLVYEEALGYGVHMSVPDKDGVSAACVFVDKACELHAEKSSFHQYLQGLRQKYGHFVTQNGYYLCYQPEEVKKLFTEFRTPYPEHVGGVKITRIRDVTTGYDNGQPDNKCTFPLTPSSQMVTVYLENGAYFTLRTSGTEPKVKYYSEMRGESADVARIELSKVVEAMASEILKPSKYPLVKP